MSQLQLLKIEPFRVIVFLTIVSVVGTTISILSLCQIFSPLPVFNYYMTDSE